MSCDSNYPFESWFCFISRLHVIASFSIYRGFYANCVDLCLSQRLFECNRIKHSLPMCPTWRYTVYVHIFSNIRLLGLTWRCTRYHSCIVNGSCEPAFGSSVDIVNRWPPAAILWIKKGQTSVTLKCVLSTLFIGVIFPTVCAWQPAVTREYVSTVEMNHH